MISISAGLSTWSTGIQTRDLKTVEPIDFTGYSKAHGAWILGDIAVRAGRVYDLNAEDYFDFGKVAVKLRSPERLLDIDYDRDNFRTDWLPKLWTAYGAKGLIALTFWQITLFAEQIREAHKSLAFLQIIGEPGSGKSTLLEFLWRLYGRDSYEGFGLGRLEPLRPIVEDFWEIGLYRLFIAAAIEPTAFEDERLFGVNIQLLLVALGAFALAVPFALAPEGEFPLQGAVQFLGEGVAHEGRAAFAGKGVAPPKARFGARAVDSCGFGQVRRVPARAAALRRGAHGGSAPGSLAD